MRYLKPINKLNENKTKNCWPVDPTVIWSNHGKTTSQTKNRRPEDQKLVEPTVNRANYGKTGSQTKDRRPEDPIVNRANHGKTTSQTKSHKPANSLATSINYYELVINHRRV